MFPDPGEKESLHSTSDSLFRVTRVFRGPKGTLVCRPRTHPGLLRTLGSRVKPRKNTFLDRECRRNNPRRGSQSSTSPEEGLVRKGTPG